MFNLLWKFNVGNSYGIKKGQIFCLDDSLGIVSTNEEIFILNKEQGTIENRREFDRIFPPVRKDKKVYVLCEKYRSYFNLVDPLQLQEVWDVNLQMGIDLEEYPPTIDDNEDIYLLGKGRFIIAIQGKNQRVKWVRVLDEDILAPPVIGIDSYIIIGTPNGIITIDKNTGDKRWSFHTGSSVQVPVCVDKEGRIFIPCTDHILYCVDGNTGKKTWEFDAGGSITHTPLMIPGGYIAIINSSKTDLFILNREDGSKACHFKAGQKIITPEHHEEIHIKKKYKFTFPPVFDSKGNIFTGESNGIIRAYNIRENRLLWSYEVENGKICDSPVLDDKGTLFVSDCNGRAIALDSETGKKIGEYKTGECILDTPLLTCDGHLFIEGCEGTIFAFG